MFHTTDNRREKVQEVLVFRYRLEQYKNIYFYLILIVLCVRWPRDGSWIAFVVLRGGRLCIAGLCSEVISVILRNQGIRYNHFTALVCCFCVRVIHGISRFHLEDLCLVAVSLLMLAIIFALSWPNMNTVIVWLDWIIIFSVSQIFRITKTNVTVYNEILQSKQYCIDEYYWIKSLTAREVGEKELNLTKNIHIWKIIKGNSFKLFSYCQ